MSNNKNDEVYGWEMEVNEILESMGIIMPASHKTGHTADDECPADYWDRYYYED